MMYNQLYPICWGKLILLGLCATTIQSFGALHEGAYAAPGKDNIAFGYGSGFGSSGINKSDIFIGTDCANRSSNNTNCIFIGENSGTASRSCADVVAVGRNTCTNLCSAQFVTDINGQIFSSADSVTFWIKADPDTKSEDSPLYYSNGVLSINSDLAIKGRLLRNEHKDSKTDSVVLRIIEGKLYVYQGGVRIGRVVMENDSKKVSIFDFLSDSSESEGTGVVRRKRFSFFEFVTVEIEKWFFD